MINFENKNNYKKTEFGEIPTDWEVKSLKEVNFLIKDGTHNPPPKRDNGIPLLSAENIIGGKVKFGLNEKCISIDEYNAIHKNYKIEKNDVLMTIVGTLGRTAIVNNDDKFSVQRSVAIFKPIINIIDNVYFNYCLNTHEFKKQIIKKSNTTAQSGLYLGELGKLKILVPSVKEQKKIASILSTVDDLIETTSHLINSYTLLKKGLMQTLLTKGIGHKKFKKTELGEIPEEWEIKKFEEIIDTLTDFVANGSFASLRENVKYNYDEDYAILIRLQDFRNNFQGPLVYVNEKSFDFLSKSKLFPGDLIISNVGSTGMVFRAPSSKKPMTLGPNAILFRSNIDNSFIYFWLTSAIGQGSLKSITTITAQPKFNKTDLRKIVCSIPPLFEQKKIASILLTVDDFINVYLLKKEVLNKLKRGLMQQLLTGKIRVKV